MRNLSWILPLVFLACGGPAQLPVSGLTAESIDTPTGELSTANVDEVAQAGLIAMRFKNSFKHLNEALSGTECTQAEGGVTRLDASCWAQSAAFKKFTESKGACTGSGVARRLADGGIVFEAFQLSCGKEFDETIDGSVSVAGSQRWCSNVTYTGYGASNVVGSCFSRDKAAVVDSSGNSFTVFLVSQAMWCTRMKLFISDVNGAHEADCRTFKQQPSESCFAPPAWIYDYLEVGSCILSG